MCALPAGEFHLEQKFQAQTRMGRLVMNDGRITSKGSYAISVQTLVGMARADSIATQEKAVLEDT